MLNEFADSLRSAVRSMRRRPAFFFVATGTLGIALGFATTMLGVVDGVLHPPVPFDDPDRTFEVRYTGGMDKVHPGPDRDAMFAAISSLPAFDAITRARVSGVNAVRAAYVGETPLFDPRRDGSVVSVPPGFFRVLGVRPRIGRTFAADEASRGNSAIVSSSIWERFFQDRAHIGRDEITIDGRRYQVVGVMPTGMNEPSTFRASVWIPTYPGDSTFWWFPHAHLRAGVTRATAEAQLAALASRISTEYNVGATRQYSFRLAPLRRESQALGGGYRAMMLVALAMIAIAISNITTLMLARAVARRRDLALRLSLGAKTSRLVFDQIAEALVLAIGGGVFGVVFALWGIGGVTHFLTGGATWLASLAPHWNARFFAISLTASAAVSILLGLLPAWQVSGIQPAQPLKESSGGATSKRARRIEALVAVELAVSLALMMATALFAKSTLKLGKFEFGFDASHVLSVTGRLVYSWDIPKIGTDDPIRVTFPRVAASKNVVSASTLAIGHPAHSQVFSEATVSIAPLLMEDYYIVGPDFMRTIGIPLIAGRDFQPGDEVRGAVVLDERAVAALFPDGKAVGKRVRFGGDADNQPWLEVIGVTKRADLALPKYLDEGVRWPPVYASVGEHDKHQWRVVARVVGNVPAEAQRIVANLNAFLPGSAAADVAWFSEDFDSIMRGHLTVMRSFLFVGLASLALACAGLFAVLSYSVNQRMREYAVRVALGAQRGNIWWLVARDAAELALAGTAIGGFAGLFVGAMYGGGLYQTDPTDVVALVSAEAVLLVVTLGVCIVPALRASRADPVEILRAA